MKRVEIKGVTVEVDEERTSALYEGGTSSRDWCQCDGCLNARMARSDATPPEQRRVLESLGLDARLPYHSSYSPKGSRSNRYTQRISCWLAYGNIVGTDASPVLGFDHDNWIWADARRERLNPLIENLDQVEPDDGDLIYLVASNRLLWLYGEVCGFRQDYVVQRCAECGSRWRMTGYLRRRSLIPEWKGMPGLGKVLRERKQRVYVEFCAVCGRMDHRVIEDRPPFRTRNTLYRDETRTRGLPPRAF